MTPEQDLPSGGDGEHGSLLVLAVLALIVGAISDLSERCFGFPSSARTGCGMH